MLPAHTRLHLQTAIWKHWAFKGVSNASLWSLVNLFPGFSRTASTNIMGSLKLRWKHTDTWTVDAKGNKTFLKTAFFSIFSPLKDSGKSATDFNKSRNWNTKIRCKKKKGGGVLKVRGPIPELFESFHRDLGAGWEHGQTRRCIYPVSARTQVRDYKDNEYNHCYWSQNI